MKRRCVWLELLLIIIGLVILLIGVTLICEHKIIGSLLIIAGVVLELITPAVYKRVTGEKSIYDSDSDDGYLKY
jgi:hypothetical protein